MLRRNMSTDHAITVRRILSFAYYARERLHQRHKTFRAQPRFSQTRKKNFRELQEKDLYLVWFGAKIQILHEIGQVEFCHY